jgi:anti-sigma factor RsiW
MNMAKLSDEDREALTAYLDGELDEAAARSVETRLNLDPKTRVEAEALKEAWSMLDYLPRAEPSPTFTHRTLERLALESGTLQRRTWHPWTAGAAWVGGLLVSAAVGFGAALLIWREPAEPAGLEERLRAIENVRVYEHADTIDFLKALDQPDLFGDEPGS